MIDTLVTSPRRTRIEHYCTCGGITRGFYATPIAAAEATQDWIKKHTGPNHGPCSKHSWEQIYSRIRTEIIRRGILRLSPDDQSIRQLLK